MSEVALRIGRDLVRLACGQCGIEFAVPDFWLESRKKGVEGENEFWCPNGHNRVFRDNELVKTKRQLENAEKRIGWMQAGIDMRDKTTTAQRGQLTKLRNRVQRGVCPACQRSFQNLRRHMETKHPMIEGPR